MATVVVFPVMPSIAFIGVSCLLFRQTTSGEPVFLLAVFMLALLAHVIVMPLRLAIGCPMLSTIHRHSL